MAEQKTYSIKIDGIEQSVKGVENLGNNLQKTDNAWKETQKALKAVKAEMAGLDKNSEQWKKLAKVAGDYKDKLDDINQAARRFASDTKNLDDAINIGQSITSVFTLAKGAMSAFGVSTEGAVESIQKLQGAMAIIQSLKSLQDTLRGSSATATLYTKAMNLLALAMGKGSTASKVLRGAMLAIPLMLVITAVTELVMHWDELVGWFTKTFPALKTLTTWFDKVKGAIAGVGNAVWEAIKSFGSLGDILGAIFSGDFDKAAEIAKNNFNKIKEAFKTGYADEMAKIQNEVTLKEVAENNKRTKHQLEMLKAQKGNAAKYSKEGIALQKKDFEERKKLAKGNKEELDKIAVEEASFYRECQESKSAAAKKAADEATKAAKKRAEEEKKEEDKRKKLHLDALESLYEAEHNMEVHEAEQKVKEAEKVVEQFKNGPEELLAKAIDDLSKAQLNLLATQVDGVWKSAFSNVQGSVSAVTADLESFKQTILDVGAVIGKKDEGLNFDIFKDAAKNVEALANLSEDELRIVYASYLDIAREFDGTVTQMGDVQAEAAKKTEESVKRIREQDRAEQEEILSKEREAIELTTLKFEEEEDKKSENAQRLLTLLNSQWDTYLAHVKGVYTEDSKEFIEAQKQKQKSVVGDSKSEKGSNQFKYKKLGKKDNPFGNFEIDFEGLEKTIEDAYDAYAAPIVEGLGDTIHMMMEFAIEEAEAALDEAEEMHDNAVDKVSESKDRLSELNEKMKESSGSQLEAYKTQVADEILLLNEREQEERRLAKEKEKREKELEKQKKRQRKLELQQQLIQAIVSGALAVVNGLATQPFLPVGIAMGALAGVMTGLQIATITKQMGKLADGGLLSGPSHSMGGIPVGNTGIEVEGGEYVVNKRSSRKYLPLLQAINEEGARRKTAANQIGKFADGGQLNYQRISENSDTLSSQNAIASAIASINFRPVVSVVDINRGQRDLTEVRQLAGANS